MNYYTLQRPPYLNKLGIKKYTTKDSFHCLSEDVSMKLNKLDDGRFYTTFKVKLEYIKLVCGFKADMSHYNYHKNDWKNRAFIFYE